MMTTSLYFTSSLSDAMYHAVAKTYSSKLPQNIYFDHNDTYVTADDHLSPLLPSKYFLGGTYMEKDRACLLIYDPDTKICVNVYAEIEY